MPRKSVGLELANGRYSLFRCITVKVQHQGSTWIPLLFRIIQLKLMVR